MWSHNFPILQESIFSTNGLTSIKCSFKTSSGIRGDLGLSFLCTYDENKGDKLNDYIVNIGSISGRIDNDTTLYKMKDGSLLSVIGKMGYENKSYYKLENDWLVRTDFASKETNDYTVGDYEIQFKACTDLSLINNYK